MNTFLIYKGRAYWIPSVFRESPQEKNAFHLMQPEFMKRYWHSSCVWTGLWCCLFQRKPWFRTYVIFFAQTMQPNQRKLLLSLQKIRRSIVWKTELKPFWFLKNKNAHNQRMNYLRHFTTQNGSAFFGFVSMSTRFLLLIWNLWWDTLGYITHSPSQFIGKLKHFLTDKINECNHFGCNVTKLNKTTFNNRCPIDRN